MEEIKECKIEIKKVKQEFEQFKKEWDEFKDNDFLHLQLVVEYMKGRQDVIFYILGGISVGLVALIIKLIVGF